MGAIILIVVIGLVVAIVAAMRHSGGNSTPPSDDTPKERPRTMRCPYCGSPATIKGNRWECGYCGDSGFLR